MFGLFFAFINRGLPSPPLLSVPPFRSVENLRAIAVGCGQSLCWRWQFSGKYKFLLSICRKGSACILPPFLCATDSHALILRPCHPSCPRNAQNVPQLWSDADFRLQKVAWIVSLCVS